MDMFIASKFRDSPKCTRLRLAWQLILAGMILQILPIHAAGYVSKWPFPVSPTGTPNFSLRLVRIPSSAFSWLTLQPVLVFDGQRYVSRIIVPELESYLVLKERGRYEWRRIDGATVQLKIGSLRAAAGGTWELKIISPTRILVVSADLNERYEYKSCVLDCFAIRGENYQIVRDVREALRIVKKDLGGDTTIVSLGRINDAETQLFASGRAFRLEFGHERELRKVTDVNSEICLLRFGYKEALLSDVTSPDMALSFVWQKGHLAEYYKPPIMMQPTIRSDGTMNYTIRTRQMYLVAEYSGVETKKRGAWMVDLVNHDVRFVEPK
jgi:hypothetical protein